MIWRCVICFVFAALTLKSLLSHINIAHSRSPDFFVTCGIDGCTKEYRVYNSFWYHIKRSHYEHLVTSTGCRSELRDRSPPGGHGARGFSAAENAPCSTPEEKTRMGLHSTAGIPQFRTLENSILPSFEGDHFGSFDTGLPIYSGFTNEIVSSLPVEQPSSGQEAGDRMQENSTPFQLSHSTGGASSCASSSLPCQPQEARMEERSPSQDSPAKIMAKHATAFVLTAREKHHLSQRGVNDVVAWMQQYQALLMNRLRDQLQTVFQKYSGGEVEKEAMAIFDCFEDRFARVSTTFMQDSAIKEQFSVVESEEVKVGVTACWVKRGTRRVLSTKNKSFYYIPLVKSLEQLLSHPKILAMIEDGPQNGNQGFLYDIVDGDLIRSHPLFSMRPSALQIILYTDEIEICNPLGSHASKHKLLMVYYTLGNINPKYRSKLAAIRLLAIAKSSDLSQCGVAAILQRVLDDLILLYNGARIQTAGGVREVYGALVTVCGDTLAQHELCGFKQGVGFAYSKCRHCECTFEDMQMYFDEDAFEQRSLDRHIRQCNEIEKAGTEFLRNSLKTTYGINIKSKLIEFPAFNLIQQTPQDVMHIILEGIAPLEIKCVLKQLVLTGQLDLDKFNAAILGFPYSPLDARDKPCPVTYGTLASSDNKLKQSSGQMLILLKILPFLFETIKGNEYVKTILELIEIVQIIFAPVITLQTVANLKLLIEKHLKHVKELFPDNNITPKQHYLIHIPSQIKLLGPMVRHMCMRFESKHCFFKQWASKLNFKNICKSLIKHNQMFECCQNANDSHHPIFSSEREIGPVSEVKNMPYLKEKLRDFLGVDEINHAVSVKWLVLNGNKYVCQKSLVVTAVNADGMPEFGLVRDIYVIDSILYCFEFQRHNTVCYDRDYMSYKVEVPHLAQANELVNAEKLVDFTPYYTFCNRNDTYVPMKYYLGDMIGLYKASSDC